ncbi:hypothetical protein D3C77_627680 [compost metagenome]
MAGCKYWFELTQRKSVQAPERDYLHSASSGLACRPLIHVLASKAEPLVLAILHSDPHARSHNFVLSFGNLVHGTTELHFEMLQAFMSNHAT